MATLYQLADEMQHALQQVEDADGEVPGGLDAVLDALNLDFEAKIENVCKAYRQYLANAAAVKIETDRLLTLQRRLENRADWLKGYLRRALELAGVDRVEVPHFKLRLQKNSAPSIELEPGAPIPEKYAVMSWKVELDKAAVTADWKAGEPLPEALRVVLGQHLRIS